MKKDYSKMDIDQLYSEHFDSLLEISYSTLTVKDAQEKIDIVSENLRIIDSYIEILETQQEAKGLIKN